MSTLQNSLKPYPNITKHTSTSTSFSVSCEPRCELLPFSVGLLLLSLGRFGLSTTPRPTDLRLCAFISLSPAAPQRRARQVGLAAVWQRRALAAPRFIVHGTSDLTLLAPRSGGHAEELGGEVFGSSRDESGCGRSKRHLRTMILIF